MVDVMKLSEVPVGCKFEFTNVSGAYRVISRNDRSTMIKCLNDEVVSVHNNSTPLMVRVIEGGTSPIYDDDDRFVKGDPSGIEGWVVVFVLLLIIGVWVL